MKEYYKRNTCRICDSTDLVQILDLGSTPPANAYLTRGELGGEEATYPLSAYYCKNCTLVQVSDVVDPSILFKDYHFTTGASFPSVEHNKRYAEMIRERFIKSPEDLVIDIGGNDGVLLGYLKDDAKVLNIDPADNLRELSEERGVPMLAEFFTSDLAKEVREKYGEAKVVTANNVTAHTDTVRDVYKGVATLIGEEGVFIAESHWVKNLIQEVAFDQIYHEHLCFYSLHALQKLAESAGLTIFDVQVIPTQGESLRIFVSKNREPLPSVKKILDIEKEAGLTDVATYMDFSDKVEKSKADLKALLAELKQSGKRIVGYGMPAKASTLLNYYGIDTDTIEYAIDTTPHKQGLYSPGVHLPIHPLEYLHADNPDYVIILVWNYADAILKKEQALRDRGVKFIVTIPKLAII